MKKIIRTIGLCLAILAVGAMATSCDKDTINQIINLIVGGKSYLYQGTYSMRLYGPNPNNPDSLIPYMETPTEYGDTRVQVTAKNASTLNPNATVDLVMPGASVTDGYTMSNVSLNGLLLNEDKISAASSSTGTGTLDVTEDGVVKTLQFYDIDIDATITADVLNIKELVVYFGDNGEYAVKLTFPNAKVVDNVQ